MSKKRPKKLYANLVNLSGLYSAKPIAVYYDAGLDDYYDKDGNFNTGSKLGTTVEWGYIKFVSESRREVECWTAGAEAVMAQLQKWCRAPED